MWEALDSLRNHSPSSAKSGMPHSGARSHRRLGWLLLLITPSASSALVKDAPVCNPKQHNCSIHLCPQHRNKFYWSGASQHRWAHILYGSSAFCYRAKAELQQTAALLSRVSCCLVEAESLLLLPCISANYSAADGSQFTEIHPPLAVLLWEA